ncbi:MAG: acetolactate decarboxylase [Alphaproteobacteria bacterium]|nr:acetolactate decarboxylase [Alphaproteobacteria bacterium]
MSRRALAAVFVLIVAAAPAQAAEVYQVSTISSLLAGGYDGTVTVGELLRHGNLGLGTYNGVDGEMVVLAGRAYRCSVDAVAHPVKAATRTPFAVVTDFHPQTTVAVPAGQSLTRLQATLDALPASESRIVAVRIVGHFQGMQVRSEPKQSPPYRPLADVIKTQQVVHDLGAVDGTLIGFRFPVAASSVNVAGWHFHFITADGTRCGHVLGLTTGIGRAALQEIADLRVRFPAQAPAASASAEAVRSVERPQ